MDDLDERYPSAGIDKVSDLFLRYRQPSGTINPNVLAKEQAFDQNLHRLFRLGSSHGSAMGAMRFFELARLRVSLRELKKPYMSPDEEWELREKLWTEFRSPTSYEGIDGGIHADRILALMRPDELRELTNSLFASLLIGAWTAFETLASDLWVVAVNGSPAWLASLTGSSDRIELLSGIEPKSAVDTPESDEGGDDDSDEETTEYSMKKITLGEIHKATRGSFNLSDKMGDLLAADPKRLKFTSLSGIREAYSLAFSEKTKKVRTTAIDAALSDRGLDAISLVRNVLVHRAGVADPIYREDAKSVPTAPKLELNEKLVLTADMARDLILPAILCGRKLLMAVDAWLKVAASRIKK
jgi:hypothetical protein